LDERGLSYNKRRKHAFIAWKRPSQFIFFPTLTICVNEISRKQYCFARDGLWSPWERLAFGNLSLNETLDFNYFSLYSVRTVALFRANEKFTNGTLKRATMLLRKCQIKQIRVVRNASSRLSIGFCSTWLSKLFSRPRGLNRVANRSLEIWNEDLETVKLFKIFCVNKIRWDQTMLIV
jgi:hypothetical protein